MLLYLTRLVRPPLAKLRVRDSWCNDSSRYSKSKHDEMGWQVFWKLIFCRGVLFYTVPYRMVKKEMGAADGRGNGAGAGVVLWRVTLGMVVWAWLGFQHDFCCGVDYLFLRKLLQFLQPFSCCEINSPSPNPQTRAPTNSNPNTPTREEITTTNNIYTTI